MTPPELLNAVDAAFDFFERVKRTIPSVPDVQRILFAVSILENRDSLKDVCVEVIRLRAQGEEVAHVVQMRGGER